MFGLLLLAVLGSGAAAAPSDQTLIYYNARMALREGEPVEAIKLWLLRNALESRTERVSAHDADFGSVTWAALGQLGLCQDNHPTDEEGAGLWPLAFHNWVVSNMGRTNYGRKRRPYDAFEVSRQQRFVSIRSVLDADELRSLDLFRSPCLRPRVMLLTNGEPLGAKLSDRLVAARLLEHLLLESKGTLAPNRVRGTSVVDARLFDLALQQISLSSRQALREAREQAREARRRGLSREAAKDIQAELERFNLRPGSMPAVVIEAALSWPISEWMALSRERRLFLFEHVLIFGKDPEATDRIAMGVIDGLIEERRGDEVEDWIANRVLDPDDSEVIWGGDRGRRLMTLDAETGFRERSVIALHRGVAFLERGQLPEALRSMAFALSHAQESRASAEVQGLSRRWLSFVASQFEVTDELLAMLTELTPRRDYNLILEDLLWHAAFNADHTSFVRGAQNQLGRGALTNRIDLLDPLARGNIGRFGSRIRASLAESPSATLRFLKQLVERLETEDADVRTSHIPTLRIIRRLLTPMLPEEGGTGGQARQAEALDDRCQSIIQGLVGISQVQRPRDSARALGPGSEVFAGSVRLAPTDPLPWPFAIPDAQAPSVFEPIELVPVEWRDERGALVFGWSIEG